MKYLPLLALLAVAGCTTTPAPIEPQPPAPPPASSPSPGGKSVDMSSAASAYCHKKGGKTEYYKRKLGLVAYCHLPNGEVIDQLELYQLRGKEAI